jgi:hypothetical protein
MTSNPFDHELKMRRAFKHLKDLDFEVKAWVGGDHHSVEYDPDARWEGPVPPGNPGPDTSTYYLAGSLFIPGQGPRIAPEGVDFGQGTMTAYATAEQPPVDPMGLLIGDVLPISDPR